MPGNAFITNSKSHTLKKRLDELIQHSQELKFLVGFFSFSGWRELYESLKSQNDLMIKLLVGLDVDVGVAGGKEEKRGGGSRWRLGPRGNPAGIPFGYDVLREVRLG